MSRRLLSRLGRCLSVLLAVAALVVLPLASPLLGWATAAEQETWLDPDHGPTVSNGSNSSWDAYDKLMRQHNGPTGSLTCTNKTLPFGQDALDGGYTSCWYQTKIGLLSDDGAYLQPAGQQYVGLVNSAESQLYPTPNPDVFIELTPTEDRSGYHLDFRTAADAAEAAAAPDGEDSPGVPQMLRWLHPATYRLTNSAGNTWVVDDNLFYSQVAYSNNGKWMAIWDYSGSVTRVDLTRFTTRTLAVEDAAGGYALMAVSDNGRYVVPVVQGMSFRVYDMDKCSAGFEVGSLPAEACTFRPLDQYLSLFLGLDTQTVYGGVPTFADDGLLSLYMFNPTDEPIADYFEYLFRAPNTGGTNYIALGDSYASGEGIDHGTFYPETNVHGGNMCHLSNQSYPFLIGRNLDLDSTHSVACSGAKTTNIANGSGPDESLQIEDRDNQYYNKSFDLTKSWTPGYVSQLKYVEHYKPNVITVSAGGNNIGFSDIVKRCLEPDTCYASYEDRLELVRMIDSQFDTFVALYESIKQATVPDAHIYVIGYPSIVNDAGDCGLNVRLNGTETKFANELVGYLNDSIQAAARRAGVQFVDVTQVFSGHRLCEGSTDERAVNGLTLGHDKSIGPFSDPVSNGSFHPTQFGHQLLEKFIEQTTHNFTSFMPRANPLAAQPVASDGMALLQAPKSGRDVLPINYDDDLSNDVAYRNGAYGEVLAPNTSTLSGLPALSSIRLWLHSDPVELGTFLAGVNGDAPMTFVVPDTVPTGFHTLNADVTYPDGHAERFSKTIYIAASPDDYDGNGVPNVQQPCLIFTGGADGDLVDACEGVYDSSPSTRVTPTDDAPGTTPTNSDTGTGSGSEAEHQESYGDHGHGSSNRPKHEKPSTITHLPKQLGGMTLVVLGVLVCLLTILAGIGYAVRR